ncbi:transglutaminase-like domain-containing protein [Neolewinella agarilytica]|uniref:transglutaminase-like domain-containing protein n=1 Tax=Neolewinella agarilytica TaxID=478744 RepID=UPI00235648AE|nr:transglutaminase-like domain-containing protein [Neolewinella agarilytica]
MKRLILLLVAFISLESSLCDAQRIVSLAQSFTIQPFTTGKIECLLPESRPGKQEAITLKYNRQPDDTLRRQGGLLAVWNISRSTELQEIIVLSTLILTENSLRKSNSDLTVHEDDIDMSAFLQPEEMIQSTDEKIGEVAVKLKGESKLETIENVFDFTRNHLEYNNFYSERQGAKKALRKGRGDCTEYAELMIALLRNLGIPSRLAMGATIKSKGPKRIEFHNWVEVYFDNRGWVSFDPTWADHENVFTTFEKMENRYILLGYGHSASAFRRWASGSGYGIAYDANWEDPTDQIELRAQLAILNDEIKSAHRSIDTLLAYLPERSQYLAFKAEAYMREGEFIKALPFIQLSIRNVKQEWMRPLCEMNLARYFANTQQESAAMDLLLEIEKRDSFYAVKVLDDALFSTLNDREKFKQLLERGEVAKKKFLNKQVD